VEYTLHKIVTPTRLIRVTACFFLAFLLVAFLAILVGPSEIAPLELLKGLFQGRPDGISAAADPGRTILFSIRIPRVLFAGVVGAALATAGVVFQALLRNPLADPFVLGVSGGASVGAISGILLGAAALPFGIPLLAFAGALAATFLVFGTARRRTSLSSNTLLLAGVIVNAFTSAVVMFLLSVSSTSEVHNAVFWLMGDLGLASGRDIGVAALVLLAAFALIYAHGRSLNLLVVGEETALRLGISVATTKKTLLAAASILTAVTVSLCGTIGFVGLIIPHMMRMALGPDHRLLLPASLLFGGGFLIVADALSRTLMAPAELPVGVITALCGAPYFVYLLRRSAP
jgi:iron complex transport system permease protein